MLEAGTVGATRGCHESSRQLRRLRRLILGEAPTEKRRNVIERRKTDGRTDGETPTMIEQAMHYNCMATALSVVPQRVCKAPESLAHIRVPNELTPVCGICAARYRFVANDLFHAGASQLAGSLLDWARAAPLESSSRGFFIKRQWQL